MRRKLKILHAIGGLSKGGAEFQCRQLANHLDPEEFEVGITYLHEGPNAALIDNVKRYPVARGSWSAVHRVYSQVDEIVKSYRPNVVHAWLPEIISVPAAVSAWRQSIPVVAGVRNTFAFEGDWNKMIRDRLRGVQYVLADRIVSNFAVDEEPWLFRKLYEVKKGSLISNGIDVKALDSLEPCRLPVRSKFRIIFAGRVAYQKGLPTIFHALSLLLADGMDIHFTVFGEGHPPYVEELKAKMKQFGVENHVTFYGQCLNWQAFANDADCLVSSTLGEGTSNVILEALAVGLPVVIADIPMTRQILRHKDNAFVVKTRSGRDWADSIKAVVTDSELKRNLSIGAKRLGEKYSVKSMVDAYASIYRELCGH